MDNQKDYSNSDKWTNLLRKQCSQKFDEDNEILLWSDFEDAMKLPEITKLFIRKITLICNLKDYSLIIF